MSLEWGQPGLFALLLTEGIVSDTAAAAEAESDAHQNLCRLH